MPKAELPENQATGEPDALKGARPVRREAAETGPCGNRADRLPCLQPQPAKRASDSSSLASLECASCRRTDARELVQSRGIVT